MPSSSSDAIVHLLEDRRPPKVTTGGSEDMPSGAGRLHVVGVAEGLAAELEDDAAVAGHGRAQLDLRGPPAPVGAQPGDPAAGPALTVALVDHPQLDLDGGAVGGHGLADHLGPERADAAEGEPGPEGEQGDRGHDPDEHGGVALD